MITTYNNILSETEWICRTDTGLISWQIIHERSPLWSSIFHCNNCAYWNRTHWGVVWSHLWWGITQYGELDFFIALLSWKNIILPNSTTSLIHFSLGRLGECTFWTWEWRGYAIDIDVLPSVHRIESTKVRRQRPTTLHGHCKQQSSADKKEKKVPLGSRSPDGGPQPSESSAASTAVSRGIFHGSGGWRQLPHSASPPGRRGWGGADCGRQPSRLRTGLGHPESR